MSSNEILKNYLSLVKSQNVPFSFPCSKNRNLIYGNECIQETIENPFLFLITTWLYEVVLTLKINKNCYFLGVDILNKYLNIAQPKNRSKLQAYSVMSLRIATCLFEFYPPPLDYYVYITDKFYTAEQLSNYYEDIARKLDGQFYIPNSLSLLDVVYMLNNFQDNERTTAMQILALLSFSKDSYKYLKNELTDASIYIFRISSGRPYENLEHANPNLKVIHDCYQIAYRTFKKLEPKLQKRFPLAETALKDFPFDPSILVKVLPNDFTSSPTISRGEIVLPSKVKVLGEGTYGTVVKAKIGKSTVAVKKQDVENICEATLEIAIMKTLKHQNIQSVKDFKFGKDSVLFTMSFQKGSLYDLIYKSESYFDRLSKWEDVYVKGNKYQDIDKNLRKKITIQSLKGLAFLHSYGIIHGDIKPGNILITPSKVVKIADFGLSQTFVPGESDLRGRTSQINTLTYRPYDVIKSRIEGAVFPRYSFDVDIWALATTIVEMETGVTPFHYIDQREPTLSVDMSVQPAATPSAQPAATPSAQSAATPSAQSAATPSAQPAATPSAQPAATPSAQPAATPSAQPAATPSAQPLTPSPGTPSYTGPPSNVPSSAGKSKDSDQDSSEEDSSTEDQFRDEKDQLWIIDKVIKDERLLVIENVTLRKVLLQMFNYDNITRISANQALVSLTG